MKKILAAIAILCMLTALASCTDKKKEEESKPVSTEETYEEGYVETEEWVGPEIEIG